MSDDYVVVPYVPYVTIPIPVHIPLRRHKILRVDQRLNDQIKFRVTRAERERIEQTCDTLGVTVAEMARTMFEAVFRELEKQQRNAQEQGNGNGT